MTIEVELHQHLKQRSAASELINGIRADIGALMIKEVTGIEDDV